MDWNDENMNWSFVWWTAFTEVLFIRIIIIIFLRPFKLLCWWKITILWWLVRTSCQMFLSPRIRITGPSYVRHISCCFSYGLFKLSLSIIWCLSHMCCGIVCCCLSHLGSTVIYCCFSHLGRTVSMVSRLGHIVIVLNLRLFRYWWIYFHSVCVSTSMLEAFMLETFVWTCKGTVSFVI